ncbi:MAG TPA: Rieske 2Fe-2S domain-containing protein [Acidimicrobiales bacterium]|nr:Rieske 2Fe-2S domain-containing protein [Acidimicrobiales bacterium]
MNVDVGALDEFEIGKPRQLLVGDLVLVGVRVGDEVFVLNDRCSHEDFSLTEGEVDVETCEIECARHGAIFRLCDGEAMTLPATTPVHRYQAFVRDGRVEVALP